jgi:hypothetical protein
MALPDPDKSQVVLIGAWDYESEAKLPAVANNLTRLEALLQDPQVCGFPPSNIHVLRDPSSPIDVLREVDAAATAAQDTLIIYFAGHGLLAPKDMSLYLALARATTSKLHEAVRFDDIRRAMVDSPARAKVVKLGWHWHRRGKSTQPSPGNSLRR